MRTTWLFSMLNFFMKMKLVGSSVRQRGTILRWKNYKFTMRSSTTVTVMSQWKN